MITFVCFFSLQVLCELQIAMLEKNIHHKDVTREIMSGEYRYASHKYLQCTELS